MDLATVSTLQIIRMHLANYFWIQSIIELSCCQTGTLRVNSDMSNTGLIGAGGKLSPMPAACGGALLTSEPLRASVDRLSASLQYPQPANKIWNHGPLSEMPGSLQNPKRFYGMGIMFS